MVYLRIKILSLSLIKMLLFRGRNVDKNVQLLYNKLRVTQTLT
jgi:hypothetical protein